ncbi:MAG TPA: hypothetical protein VFM13_05560 [Gaiellaceae bacterium]|nr:hypothetical protein [Gaiellaceae bacterium]
MKRRPLLHHAASVSVLVLVLVLVPAALAAKGGGGKPGGSTSGSSISLAAPLVYDGNGDGLPNHGDVVLFTVSTTATTQPFVNLRCYQNGALVLNHWNGYFEGAFNYNRNFGLASSAWQGGAAACTATLNKANRNGSWTQLASTSFHVDA